MECVQVGLQQGGFGGLFLKRSSSSSPRPLIWQEVVNGQNGGVSSSAGDDSFVDQLLNLNAENTQEEVDAEEEDYNQVQDKNSALPSSPPPLQPPSTAGEDDFGSLLTLPEEEADLEWLSHFVEDSFAQFSHAQLPAKPTPEILQPLSPLSPPSVLPRSRRSKRLRPAAVRSWTQASPRISSSLTDSTTSSSQSSSATSSPYWPTSPSTPLAFPNPKKKKGLGRAKPAGESRPGSTAMRRCSHCGTQKTPQWRAGPMGSKTLCNACGVRFKTGRLFPEYRPACSPTFSSELHSNSHRKVLEMRRMKKETVGYTEPGSVSAEPN